MLFLLLVFFILVLVLLAEEMAQIGQPGSLAAILSGIRLNQRPQPAEEPEPEPASSSSSATTIQQSETTLATIDQKLREIIEALRNETRARLTANIKDDLDKETDQEFWRSGGVVAEENVRNILQSTLAKHHKLSLSQARKHIKKRLHNHVDTMTNKLLAMKLFTAYAVLPTRQLTERIANGFKATFEYSHFHRFVVVLRHEADLAKQLPNPAKRVKEIINSQLVNIKEAVEQPDRVFFEVEREDLKEHPQWQ